LRNYSNDNCTVHWIYRKALFKGDLRNHKGHLLPTKSGGYGQCNNSEIGLMWCK
jgi:hypothetical protein